MKAILFCFCCISLVGLRAQNAQPDSLLLSTPDSLPATAPGIGVIGKSTGKEIILRWAPNHHLAWQFLNSNGYFVERALLARDSVFNTEPVYKRLTSAPVRPLPLEQWAAVVARDSIFGAVAAQAIHGKDFVTQIGDLQSISDRYAEETNRWALALFSADMSAAVADASGLRFIDADIKQNEMYVYRILPNVPVNTFAIDTGYCLVKGNEIQTPGDMPDPTVVDGDRFLIIHWNVVPEFTAYILERSEDGKVFAPVTSIPLVGIKPDFDKSESMRQSYVDSLRQNYEPVFYRMKGLNAFGEESAYSQVVTGYGRDLTPPIPPNLREAKLLLDAMFELRWDKPVVEPDLLGYFVEWAPAYDGPFERKHEHILPPDAKTHALEGDFYENNFFRIVAVDTAGNISFSNKTQGVVIDSIPPNAPLGLSGNIDSSGIVTIHWPLGPEPDIMGYRVFFSNAPEHRFVNLTGYIVQDTIFRDTTTLNTLSKKLYYKVVAVDRNFNHSPFSETLVVIRPDTVPPTAPVFSDVMVTDSTVLLRWIPSTSSDVAAQWLHRKDEQTDWERMAAFVPEVEDYLVKGLTPGKYYSYAIEAVDSSGNRSGWNMPVAVRVYIKSKTEAIENFQIRFDNPSKGVLIEWEAPELRPKHFLIYRGFNDFSLSSYKSIDATMNSFTDKAVTGKGIYRYAVKAIYQDGSQSMMSSVLEVMIE